MDRFYAQAFDTLTSRVDEVFNLHSEPATMRERYGKVTACLLPAGRG
ncbi:MAG: hypothetical protein U0992_14405 [Planctomycetaceae bacterium]